MFEPQQIVRMAVSLIIVLKSLNVFKILVFVRFRSYFNQNAWFVNIFHLKYILRHSCEIEGVQYYDTRYKVLIAYADTEGLTRTWTFKAFVLNMSRSFSINIIYVV